VSPNVSKIHKNSIHSIDKETNFIEKSINYDSDNMNTNKKKSDAKNNKKNIKLTKKSYDDDLMRSINELKAKIRNVTSKDKSKKIRSNSGNRT